MIGIPRGIPIAAVDATALQSLGAVMSVSSFRGTEVLALWPWDRDDEPSVWVDPSFRNYVGAWRAAARSGVVEDSEAFGRRVDIDHVYPKSWAVVDGMQMGWVRLFPVLAEVNRSAGGREKRLLDGFRGKPERLGSIVFARELQVLKLLGHPVGTFRTPERLGGRR